LSAQAAKGFMRQPQNFRGAGFDDFDLQNEQSRRSERCSLSAQAAKGLSGQSRKILFCC
jgi:hypothetical protein